MLEVYSYMLVLPPESQEIHPVFAGRTIWVTYSLTHWSANWMPSCNFPHKAQSSLNTPFHVEELEALRQYVVRHLTRPS